MTNENIINIDSDLDSLILDMLEENNLIDDQKKIEYKEEFTNEKDVFNKWIGESFDKTKTPEYAESILLNKDYSKVPSFYKNMRKNVKENIKLLGHVLEEKGFSDIKSDFWDQLSTSTVIGIKKNRENNLIEFLLKDQKIQEFIKENKGYNETYLLNIDLNSLSKYSDLSLKINNKKVPNSFYGKTDDELIKLSSKSGIDYASFGKTCEYNWQNIYLSLLDKLIDLGGNLDKLKGILTYSLSYLLLEGKEETKISELLEKVTKITKKNNELRKLEEYDYYYNWLKNDNFHNWLDRFLTRYKENYSEFTKTYSLSHLLLKGKEKKVTNIMSKINELKKIEKYDYYYNWLKNDNFHNWLDSSLTIYKSSPPEFTKTFATKIWNLFKSASSDINEIKEMYKELKIKDKTKGITDYIIGDKDVYQTFLDLGDYKTITKQMLLSGYFFQGDRVIETNNLKDILNKLLIEDYSITKDFKSITTSLEFITNENYEFVKEYKSQDELLPQRLIQRTDHLLKVNRTFKDIDYYVINYIKEFFFKYLIQSDKKELFSNESAHNLLLGKKGLSKGLENLLDNNYEHLCSSIKNIDKDVYIDKLSKKHVYILTLKEGNKVKFTIKFKKDIFIKYKKDISYNDIIQVKNKIIDILIKNFPNQKEIFNTSNTLITHLSKTKMLDNLIYHPTFDLNGLLDSLDKDTLSKIQAAYENLYNEPIENIKFYLKEAYIADYIFVSLLIKDIIYIYQKKVI